VPIVDESPIIFNLNLLSGGIGGLDIPILPAQADVQTSPRETLQRYRRIVARSRSGTAKGRRRPGPEPRSDRPVADY
jgi:hypothetical protein